MSATYQDCPIHGPHWADDAQPCCDKSVFPHVDMVRTPAQSAIDYDRERDWGYGGWDCAPDDSPWWVGVDPSVRIAVIGTLFGICLLVAYLVGR